MKAFFEEYGFILVTVIVMVALIALVGNDSSGLVQTISTAANKAVTKMTPDYLQ